MARNYNGGSYHRSPSKSNPDEVSLKALAKINIGLDVTGEREDGYHDVRMIMQSIHLYDRVEIRRVRSPHIHVEANLYYVPSDESNLAYKAAKLLKDKYDIRDGVHITLQKFIPVSAGLGGGSADAAAVLVGMNRIFHLGIRTEELAAIGAGIGADVPFCVIRGTALAEGIGEKITVLPPMPRCQVLIAKPGVAVSTKHVYGQLKLTPSTPHPNIDGIIEGINRKDLSSIAENMGNILETVTVTEYPVIREIKSLMRENGAAAAMMSGSGPSVFGLFKYEKDLKNAYEAMKASGLAKNVYASETYANHR
ncbi:MAG: 4-(cytidine 5'-diphospho)-2-C-methyl-D-erythritol kinase [Clostridiales bacterium]|nr:4-(cytidine 5'-diphospho)-2-C-methyl-D-erythritol kinase [Clostridiales bacterium]